MVKVKDRPKVGTWRTHQYVNIPVSVDDYRKLESTYWYAAKSDDALWVYAGEEELVKDSKYSPSLNDEIDALRKSKVAMVCFLVDYQKS